MSISKFIEKVEVDLGIFGQLIAAHVSIALQITINIDHALKSPIVDGILEAVLPPSLSSHIPQAVAFLDKAITDLTIGTQIEVDMAAQTTTEGKLKIFLEDLQKYNAFLKHALLQKLCSMILAGIDNGALSEVLYDTYSQAQYALQAPGNK